MSHVHGLIGMYGNNSIDDIQVKDFGDETSTHALNLVGTLRLQSFSSLGLGDEHLLTRLHGDRLELWFERLAAFLAFDELGNTGNL